MTAPLPLFAEGEFPFAETLPRVCPWCRGQQLTSLRGPREARWAISEHPDRRTCDSNRYRPSKYVRTTHCYNVSADLAAVALDRVAELPRRLARVRVDFAGYRVGMVMRATMANGRQIDVPHEDIYTGPHRGWQTAAPTRPGMWHEYHTAICHAHPTYSQHLAECLLNDPDIASLLEGVREEHGIEPANNFVSVPYLNARDFVGTITVGDGTQPIYTRDFQ